MPGRPPGDDPDRPESAPDSASEDTRFADLQGDVRRIDKGPERVPSPRRQPVSRSAGREPTARREAFRWPDPSDRHRAAATGVSDAVLLDLARGEPDPEERIDLHGVRREGVASLLERRLASARSRGLRCVLVIHGRGARSASGEGVLRERIPDWLSRAPLTDHVLAFAPAPERLGGSGATLVRLRRR